jgi:hypothetical protein
MSMTATVTVPAATTVGNYTVTLQATTAGALPLTTSFIVAVALNPNFVLSEPSAFPNVKMGSVGTSGLIAISAVDGFTGTVSVSCDTATFGANSCSVSPASVSSYPATVNLIINGTSFTAGSYQIAVQGTSQGTSGPITNSLSVPFDVGTYLINGPSTLSSAPGGQAAANLSLTSTNLYSGQVNATCDASALSGAQCTITPANPIVIGSGAVVALTASINVPDNASPGMYSINLNTQDVNGAPGAALTMALTVIQDFTVGALTPATQTITPGQSASYNFSVLPVGATFTDAVTLSCSGAPVISLCSFTPNPVTPGSSSAAVVLTITTTSSSASLSPQTRGRAVTFYALWLALPAIILLGTRSRKRSRLGGLASMLGLFLLAFTLLSCGGGTGIGGGGGGGQQQGTQPGTYTITVTGTSGTLSHAASPVTLVVSP